MESSIADQMERADAFYGGYGPQWGPPMPQRRPTAAEAERFATAWAQKMEAIRDEIEKHDAD